jgi:hypothetical protein
MYTVGPAKIQRVQQKIPGCWTYVQQNENKFQKVLKVIRLSQSPVEGGTGRFTFARLSSIVMLQERPHCHVAGTVSKILNRNGFGEGNDTNQGCHVFLSEFLKFVGPIGPRGQKIMRSTNNVGNAGLHVCQTFLNDQCVYFFNGSRKRRSHCKYRNKFGQLGIRNSIEYVIFYLFLVNIIGNCRENKYI